MRFNPNQPGGGPAGGRDSYHHGNLREVLIEAALHLLGEHGPAGFTFADVARAVGVSPAAPYRHFRDRQALLTEVARRAFEKFAAELDTAWNGGRPDPVRAIENCALAYLSFARREPAAFAAMYESGLPMSDDPTLLAASELVLGVLRRAADAACAASHAARRPPALMVALHVQAMAHGVAALYVSRAETSRRKLPMPPEDLLEAGLLIYLQSLGIAPSG